jgi:hypothetical protein
MRLCQQCEIDLVVYMRCPTCFSDFNQILTFSKKCLLKALIKILTGIRADAEGRTDMNLIGAVSRFTQTRLTSFLLYLASTQLETSRRRDYLILKKKVISIVLNVKFEAEIRRHISEDSNLQQQRCEHLKPLSLQLA